MSVSSGQARLQPFHGGPAGSRNAGSAALTHLYDRLFHFLSFLAALSVIVLSALLVVILLVQSWPAITTIGGRFFTGITWDPVRDEYGALAFVWGTVATSVLAMLIAVPLSVGTAVFLAEIAPNWLRRGGSFLVELLAAIPSVVYGFWGIFFLAPVVQRLFFLLGGPNTGGVGIFSAGLIVAIMIVPYITAISYDACRAVPSSQRQAGLALGATRWQTIWSVILPYARPGIVGACFLAVGRALGETMAVTMLIGNSPKIDFSLFALGDSIASVIANQLQNTSKELHRSALVELGLVLLLVSIIVNCLARLLIWRVGRVGERRPLWALLPRFRKRKVLPVSTSTVPTRWTALAGNQKSAQAADRVMTCVLGGCLFLTVGFFFLILSYIVFRGITTINWDFFTHAELDTPSGLGHAILGSGMLVGLATLCAVPLSLMAGIYLAEYPTGRLVPAVRFIGELLGGVPSIILGIFGYALLVVPWGDFSGWAGAFALGVMMIPVVMRASEEALKMVPQSLRNASYALGASTWQTIVRVSVPAALPAIVTGVFLAIARIAGETAPLLLTAYNSTSWPTSPSARTPFLTYYIYTYSRSDDPHEQQLAWAGAVVLLGVVIVLNVGIRLVTGKRSFAASQTE